MTKKELLFVNISVSFLLLHLFPLLWQAYEPMARIAEKCVKANKFDDCIKLIDRRSTTSVSGNGDMSLRAQLLVTEIYDSELIGEGGLDTIYHAFKHMLNVS